MLKDFEGAQQYLKKHIDFIANKAKNYDSVTKKFHVKISTCVIIALLTMLLDYLASYNKGFQ